MSGLPIQVDSRPADYHTLVYPTIGGVVAGKLRCNANSGALIELRYCVMSTPDDVLAAQRLAVGYPDCRIVYPGDPPEQIDLSAGAGYLYLLPVAFGGTDTTPANGIVDASVVTNDNGGATVGGVGVPGITQAQILGATSQIRAAFDSADVARQISLRIGPTYDSGKRAVIELEAASYA